MSSIFLFFSCTKIITEDPSAIESTLKNSTSRPTGTCIPANGRVYIVPDRRVQTLEMDENHSSFVCPPNMVMTGRYHSGDENKPTIYEYATLKAVDGAGNDICGDISVVNIVRHHEFKESSGDGFDAQVSQSVIVGRDHDGDENGNTAYYTAEVLFTPIPGGPARSTYVIDYITSESKKESRWDWFHSSDKQVITGRHHKKDENGNTFYSTGTIVFDPNLKVPNNLYRVVVMLHEDERYFPMNPQEFIGISRFRHCLDNVSDEGYHKYLNQWLVTNSHDPEYYNIPVGYINSWTLNSLGQNCRPKDPNNDANGGNYGYFIEPDDNLEGNLNPNFGTLEDRLPVFDYIVPDNIDPQNNGGTRRQLWMFYGYDYSDNYIFFDYSHQGDWENVVLKLSPSNRIIGATLSQHNDSSYYPDYNLEIKESNGWQTLYIYSAQGTHANYKEEGNFGHAGTDHCNGDGYQWVITDKVLKLEDQSWKDFAGAWGEVGGRVTNTGPLGPWFKKIRP